MLENSPFFLLQPNPGCSFIANLADLCCHVVKILNFPAKKAVWEWCTSPYRQIRCPFRGIYSGFLAWQRQQTNSSGYSDGKSLCMNSYCKMSHDTFYICFVGIHCFKFRRIFRQIDVVRRGTSANRRKYSGIFSRCICAFFPVAFRVQRKFPVRIFHDMFCYCRSVANFCGRTVWNTALES